MNKMPSESIMYRALLERDPSFEGLFIVGVKTTGIFCRPTCPARKPKKEHVDYFTTPQEAMLAGYRPCARCHPLEKEKPSPELVTQLCTLVEQDPTRRIRNADLVSLGIDPSTARRQFQRHCGLTFQAYQRSRRIGMALRRIRDGESVIGAQIDHGYESASGFFEAFKQLSGMPPSRAGQVSCLFARWLETPLGPMIALANDEGLQLLEFVDRRGLENEILLLRKQTGSFVVPGNHRYLDQIATELREYFDGVRTQFDVPVMLHGSEFERKVWTLLQKIPHGSTRSYLDMAKRLGQPRAVRAVGRANGRNRLAIIVPCHRVIRADGSLCGYGGGIWRKEWLLANERSMATAATARPSEQTRTIGASGVHAHK